VQVVDAAQVPDRPDSAYRLLILVSAIVCALPVGLAVALAAELAAALRAWRRHAGSWKRAIEAACVVTLSGGAQ
jgi:hypothetical protein